MNQLKLFVRELVRKRAFCERRAWLGIKQQIQQDKEHDYASTMGTTIISKVLDTSCRHDRQKFATTVRMDRYKWILHEVVGPLMRRDGSCIVAG